MSRAAIFGCLHSNAISRAFHAWTQVDLRTEAGGTAVAADVWLLDRLR